MARPEVIADVKGRIDRGEIKVQMHLNNVLTSLDCDDEERRICSEYLKSKKTPSATVAKAFSSTFSRIDFEQLGTSPFEENGEAYDPFSPQWWFVYYWNEVKKEKLSAEERQLGMEAVQALFDKVEDKTHARGFRLRLKPDLTPVKGTPPSPGAAPRFNMTPEAADTWSKALTKLMLIGFRRAPLQFSATSASSTETSMLESNFVSMIKKEAHELRVFWRGDTRDKTAFQGGAKRSVEDKEARARYAINQPWHPLKKKENRQYLWFRRGSADNDFYTVVSVTTKIDTAATFPLIEERRAYATLPLKPLATWSDQEVMDNRQYLAEVLIQGSRTMDVMIATPTNVFMLAINGGVVIDTRSAGAHYRGEDKGFPESGVQGYAYECFIGVIPIVRLHFGHTKHDGFKAYLDPSRRPELFYSREELVNRFGELGASQISRQFLHGQRDLNRMVAAWSSYGAVTPEKTVEVLGLLRFPLPEDRAHTYLLRRKQFSNV